MSNVVRIRLKDAGKTYDFDPDDLVLKTGDLVIIDSEKGPGIGEVVKGGYEADVSLPLKKVIRKASEEDLKQVEENKALEKDITEFCRTKINEMGLPMKLVGTELSFDGSKVIFFFTSEGRVDFRELVKELAAKFKIRIEMKQIGVRDEARLVGGYGCCGRALCCETFIKDFEPVSIRMAKKQELALNPTKISGVCGRLMCCLVFEYEIYDEIKKDTNKLKDIEKSLIPEVDHSEETSLDLKDSAGSLIPSTRADTEPIEELVKPDKVNPVEPSIPSLRRRRRRRKRRHEGINPLGK